jgi:GNAT superfamily N-acetyltransferase
MTDITVRRALAEDRETVRALLVALGYAHLADDPGFEAIFAAVLADPSRGVWLAERGGEVLGLVTTMVQPQLRLAGVQLTIEELVVHERARGTGVGRTLVAHVQEEARRVGARRVELTTNRTRPVYLRGFYPSCGFAEASSAVMRWSPK